MSSAPPDISTGPEAPYALTNGDHPKFPVLVSVPHAGRDYPPELLQNLNVPASHLLRLEDRYADRLATGVQAAGFPVIVARKPRAWIDLNRGRAELDPDMIAGLEPAQTPYISRKVRGGLGIVPRRLHGAGNLWRGKWQYRHVMDRIEQDHEPYHAKVGAILERMRSLFGGALLLDLHSMPSVFDEEGCKVAFVIGDRFGRSCESRYAELAAEHFRTAGHRVQTNHPYSGGYVLERHGKPDRNIHALQLEVDRSLYLDRSLREPVAAAATIADLIRKACAMLADHLSGRGQLEAAE